MTPAQIARTAQKIRERYPLPDAMMTPGRYVSCEAMDVLADALVAVGVEDDPDAIDEPGRPDPDEALLRREALEIAVRSLRGDETPDQMVERARSFAGFLRGDTSEEQRAYPFVDGPHLVLGPECFTGDGSEVPQTVISWRGENFYSNRGLERDSGDLDVLEQLLGFIRERTFEDASGLRSLQGQELQDEAKSFLVDSNFEQLRMMAHLATAARALVVAELNRRNS